MDLEIDYIAAKNSPIRPPLVPSTGDRLPVELTGLQLLGDCGSGF
ncbi:hypothetical protein [[Phormidium] sp. ETS-05]|nr:hypothetical protein [[Phormidium] sp. ETS-05]